MWDDLPEEAVGMGSVTVFKIYMDRRDYGMVGMSLAGGPFLVLLNSDTSAAELYFEVFAILVSSYLVNQYQAIKLVLTRVGILI